MFLLEVSFVDPIQYYQSDPSLAGTQCLNGEEDQGRVESLQLGEMQLYCRMTGINSPPKQTNKNLAKVMQDMMLLQYHQFFFVLQRPSLLLGLANQGSHSKHDVNSNIRFCSYWACEKKEGIIVVQEQFPLSPFLIFFAANICVRFWKGV